MKIVEITQDFLCRYYLDNVKEKNFSIQKKKEKFGVQIYKI